MHFYLSNLSVSKINYCIIFSGFIKHIVAFPLDCEKEKNCEKEIFCDYSFLSFSYSTSVDP